MAGIFDIVAQAGSLPLDELKIRASQADVETRVSELKQQGLVDVKKETVPEFQEKVDVISLTSKGFKAALR